MSSPILPASTSILPASAGTTIPKIAAQAQRVPFADLVNQISQQALRPAATGGESLSAQINPGTRIATTLGLPPLAVATSMGSALAGSSKGANTSKSRAARPAQRRAPQPR